MREEVVVREFEPEKDGERVEALERTCEVGPSGEMSLFTDLLGDPLSRVRRSPAFLMLVAETTGTRRDIVGVVRGCIKTAAVGKKPHRSPSGAKHHTPVYTKLAYLLGLRVSPAHRRMGIGLNLVQRMEDWFRSKGAEYAYMATERDNEASVRLFTGRCGYTMFRSPAILVNPVFAHHLPLQRGHRRRPAIAVVRLSPADAEAFYRLRLATTEFFPRDIDAVLHNPLSLGTFLAVPASHPVAGAAGWSGADSFLADSPESWAVLSVWNCKDVFRLEVRGAGWWQRGLAQVSRAVDRALPFLRLPSFPDIFRPFGLYLLYGIGGAGTEAAEMVRVLCRHAHNMAREGGCGVVAAEVAAEEPLRQGIPHWRRLSCAEDLWCVKRLAEDYSDGAVGDWTRAPPGKSIFVDPREF
ncbi:hypothetical protein AXF42_Ash000110 [Apostasia shenzhenica]|uniref:N-acetyltransferase domain-containing protein n=1 Tax=Apostasia shenzhenica TaxID=1088818 RepID=A0A2I0AFG3_9ASPA|nr:hypothetical protein AXF42_Ash000110 [Apostasia shenzhenica]